MSNLSEAEQSFAHIVQAARFLATDPEARAKSAAIAADFSVADDELWAMIESDEVAIDEAISSYA